MNVSCGECQSVFRVDPAKVPAGGVRARCSVCGAVMQVGMEPDGGAAATATQASRDATRRAMMESDAAAAPMGFEPSARERTPVPTPQPARLMPTPARPATPARPMTPARPATPARPITPGPRATPAAPAPRVSTPIAPEPAEPPVPPRPSAAGGSVPYSMPFATPPQRRNPTPTFTPGVVSKAPRPSLETPIVEAPSGASDVTPRSTPASPAVPTPPAPPAPRPSSQTPMRPSLSKMTPPIPGARIPPAAGGGAPPARSTQARPALGVPPAPATGAPARPVMQTPVRGAARPPIPPPVAPARPAMAPPVRPPAPPAPPARPPVPPPGQPAAAPKAPTPAPARPQANSSAFPATRPTTNIPAVRSSPAGGTPVGGTPAAGKPAPTATPASTTPAGGAPHATPGTARRAINPFLNNDPDQKGRRLARALVSDMIAYMPGKREEGLRDGTLKTIFREEIKKSHEEYVEQIGKEFAESTTHFTDALNDLLAGGEKVF